MSHILRTSTEHKTTSLADTSDLSKDKCLEIVLYGNDAFSTEQNHTVLNDSIVFIIASERVDVPLL